MGLQKLVEIQFRKYHGLGNDFILIDNRQSTDPILTHQEAVLLCSRHYGVGADGVIFALPSENPKTDYSARIFNSDGSEPEMCGNGIRCLALFLADLEGSSAKSVYSINTLAGLIKCHLISDRQVKVEMGHPRLLPAEIPTTLASQKSLVVKEPLEMANNTWTVSCVNMGNPHCIIFVDDVSSIPLESVGPSIEFHTAFPERINVEFAEVVRRDYIKMSVWEKGSGKTLACGTGACAVLVAAFLNNLTERKAVVELPGGNLDIEWGTDNSITMTGPALYVYSGQFSKKNFLI